MQLSVVIVNYNVCYFLEQCLASLQAALKNISSEIIVVDNHSTDNSRDYLPLRFPGVRFIWNESNPGFSRANNQGAAMARGEYLLILNPDTILPETCLETALDFIRSHPDAGAVGMRMFDGRFRYLPESKRGLPDFATAFFKLSGLIRLFPTHPRIGRYYLGHLSPDKIHPIEVLAGAFMLIPRAAYLRVGGFDERYFMYGEDIDLSYSLSRAGYRNYYLPEPGILHFKGESTVRSAENARHFYEAMLLFRNKYGKKSSVVSKMLVEIAIRLRTVREKLRGTEPAKTRGANRNGMDPASADFYLICADLATYQSDRPTIFLLGGQLKADLLFERFRKEPPRAPVRFRWIGTAAAVGSDHPDQRGEIILE